MANKGLYKGYLSFCFEYLLEMKTLNNYQLLKGGE